MKLRSNISRITWNYSSDGRSSPTDAGDDNETKAFVLQPGDAHIVGVALSVTLWGESRLEIGLKHVGIVDTVPEISFLPGQTVEGGSVAEPVWQSNGRGMKLEKALVSGLCWWAVYRTPPYKLCLSLPE